LSRAKSRRNLDFQDVLDKLADMGIAIRVASPKLVMEEVREILRQQFLVLQKLMTSFQFVFLGLSHSGFMLSFVWRFITSHIHKNDFYYLYLVSVYVIFKNSLS
jgi:hypothetical protein